MPLYRPVRTTASAVPDALASLRSDLGSLASATSGQINGTVAKLKAAVDRLDAQVRATPAVYTNHGETRFFTSPPKAGTTVVSVSMTVPAGKTRAHIMCGVYAQIPGNSRPYLQVTGQEATSLGSTYSGGMTMANALRSVSTGVTEGQTLTVSIKVGSDVAGTDDFKITLDTFTAFTN
ncbi:hypothetical protein [Actinomyces radicidentis]|uniref:hypothetical protein n=1 Tax=Actinomyces radicidentis TaxID=111015 RepID=UPI0028EC86C8|nr:hypothetical protein [Actinomyces radicidentis]